MNHGAAISLAGVNLKKCAGITLATLFLVIALPVMAVFSFGHDAVAFLNSSPNAESAEQQGFYMGGPVSGDTYAWGNCTYWAFANRLWVNKPIPTTWGNANTWAERAMADGYNVDHTPLVGAVMQTTAGDLGHVAYVIAVDSKTGQWTISEMNAPHLNVVDTRTFSASTAVFYSFIHDKKIAS
jgi:surface antigen